MFFSINGTKVRSIGKPSFQLFAAKIGTIGHALLLAINAALLAIAVFACFHAIISFTRSSGDSTMFSVRAGSKELSPNFVTILIMAWILVFWAVAKYIRYVDKTRTQILAGLHRHSFVTDSDFSFDVLFVLLQDMSAAPAEALTELLQHRDVATADDQIRRLNPKVPHELATIHQEKVRVLHLAQAMYLQHDIVDEPGVVGQIFQDAHQRLRDNTVRTAQDELDVVNARQKGFEELIHKTQRRISK